MSYTIDVEEKTITSSVTVDQLEIQYINVDLVNQTINVAVKLLDIHTPVPVVGNESVTISSVDFESVFNTSTFNSLILSTLDYNPAT